MRNIAIILLVSMSTALFSVYNIGDTVSSSDNISWTDNFGYSSNIFTEVMKGKPVMIFFGGYG